MVLFYVDSFRDKGDIHDDVICVNETQFSITTGDVYFNAVIPRVERGCDTRSASSQLDGPAPENVQPRNFRDCIYLSIS